MFVIENKLSLSDRRGKLMHYPESPKVSAHWSDYNIKIFSVDSSPTLTSNDSH